MPKKRITLLNKPPCQLLILSLCIVYFLALSIPGILMGYSYWVDELYTIQFISGTWTELISKYILPDTHPPLYFITAKAWTSLFGTHEASTRTLSSIFSLALIITLWNEWRAKASPRRLILLLLIIINPYFLYYSQETIGYSLLLFL